MRTVWARRDDQNIRNASAVRRELTTSSISESSARCYVGSRESQLLTTRITLTSLWSTRGPDRDDRLSCERWDWRNKLHNDDGRPTTTNVDDDDGSALRGVLPRAALLTDGTVCARVAHYEFISGKRRGRLTTDWLTAIDNEAYASCWERRPVRRNHPRLAFANQSRRQLTRVHTPSTLAGARSSRCVKKERANSRPVISHYRHSFRPNNSCCWNGRKILFGMAKGTCCPVCDLTPLTLTTLLN